MTTVFLAPTFGAGYQSFTNGGLPNNLGYINTWQAGASTTPQATYTTSAGNVQNANPILLDSSGRPPSEIWLITNDTYRFDIYDSIGNLIKTYDYLPGINDTGPLAASSGSSLIGFIQAGAGAVARTVQSKERDFINAADFGMSTSATAAANKTALVAALASLGSTGGTIFISKGTYSIAPGIVLTNSQKSITICGAANAMGYEDNAATAATVLNFTTGSIGFDLSAADGTIAAGDYIRITNLCIKGGGLLAYGIKANGLVILDHMNVSTCTTAGVWLNEFINMTALDHMSCTGNTGAFGLLVGSGAATLKDNTIFRVSHCDFRQNLVGVRLEQATNYSFSNCVIESNAREGLVLYRIHTGTGHSQNTTGRFQNVWFENNGASDDTRSNLLSDAGTRSYNTTDTPSYMVFESCTFTCSETSTPGTFRPNITIDCGNYFDFNNCTIQTSDPLVDGASKSPVNLNAYSSNFRFYNTAGNSIFTDIGSQNCTALSSYYSESAFTVTLTGCTATVTGTAYYTRTGNVVVIDLPTLTGTSNSVNKTLTGLPSPITPSGPKNFQFFGSDNGGAYGVGWNQLSAGVFTLSKDGSGTVWTNAGTFTMRGPSISYTLA